MSPSELQPDLTAAELALGLLDGEGRAVAERRRAEDPGFAAEVEEWSWRLARIAEDEVQERAPPAYVWQAVQRELAFRPDREVVRLHRRLVAWRGLAAGASAVAAVLALALWLRPPTVTAPRPLPLEAALVPASLLSASLSTGATGPIAFIALLDPQRGELVLTPARVTARADKVPELWSIPEGGRPVVLGLGQFGAPVRLKLGADAPTSRTATLAVSLEPLGGSPTGQPTGPVIASGKLRTL